MIEKIDLVLRQEGFESKRDYNFGTVFADLYANRKGRTFIFPRRDYIFFHDIDKRQINLELASKLHQEARDYVNSFYKMPKAMRFTVPNISTVFYSSEFITGEIMEFAQKNTRSAIGGEIQQVFAIDFKAKRFYSQGTNTVTGRSGGVNVKIKFNAIDPQNRSYEIIKKLLK